MPNKHIAFAKEWLINPSLKTAKQINDNRKSAWREADAAEGGTKDEDLKDIAASCSQAIFDINSEKILAVDKISPARFIKLYEAQANANANANAK